MFPKKKEFRKSFEVNASKLTISFNTPKRPIKKNKGSLKTFLIKKKKNFFLVFETKSYLSVLRFPKSKHRKPTQKKRKEALETFPKRN
jgi:hypothetical protein